MSCTLWQGVSVQGVSSNAPCYGTEYRGGIERAQSFSNLCVTFSRDNST
jgi:hypothetical protein